MYEHIACVFSMREKSITDTFISELEFMCNILPCMMYVNIKSKHCVSITVCCSPRSDHCLLFSLNRNSFYMSTTELAILLLYSHFKIEFKHIAGALVKNIILFIEKASFNSILKRVQISNKIQWFIYIAHAI